MKQLQTSNTGPLATAMTLTNSAALAKPLLTTPEYDTLQARKTTLLANLQQVQMALYEKKAGVERINELQLLKAKHEAAIEEAEAALAEIEPELDNFDKGAEKVLLAAISGQRWWFIENHREVIYDSHKGRLFPNFKFVNDITNKAWDDGANKSFGPGGFAVGKWSQAFAIKSLCEDICANFPKSNREKKKYLLGWDKDYWYYDKDSKFEITQRCNSCDLSALIIPFSSIFSRSDLDPSNKSLTPLEKAAIVLAHFLEQAWLPVFDQPEARLIFDNMVRRNKLQAEWVKLEKQIAELPAPEIKTTFTSDFDYTQPLREYDVAAANQSVWQYTHSAKRWLGYLLAQLDDWSRENQSLLDCAHRINSQLTQKLPLGKDLTDDEKTMLQQRRLALQTRLNFNLEPLRAALIRFNGQLETLEKDLHQLNRADDSRPPLELLAEHTATLCTETLKGLEWLGERQEFVRHLVAAENERAEQYAVFVDKFQPDLYTQAADNSIDRPEVEVWFGEWRRERRQMEAQWLPLWKS